MDEAFRAFVAIEIPAELRARCAEVARRLAGAAGKVSWVKAENLHLTLKFLGEAEPRRIERMVESLAHKAAKVEPFEAGLAGLGCFPSPRKARVIWIGVSEGADALRDLAARVDGAAGKAGFEREARAFSPHLTLGRVRMSARGEGGGADLGALLAREDPGPLGRFPVRELVLMRSRLGPGGSVYTPLHRVALGR